MKILENINNLNKRRKIISVKYWSEQEVQLMLVFSFLFSYPIFGDRILEPKYLYIHT